MKEVIIIDSGGANLASLRYALERLGARAHVSSDSAAIAAAARVILPGVGSARDAMRRLAASGLAARLPSLAQPVLGICLGMQLLYRASEEGATPCLGVLPDTVRRLPSTPGLPVPHMGWNQLSPCADDPLMESVPAGAHVYFVHSFAAPVTAATRATTHYGVELSALVRHRNFWGTQFHPERSGGAGARILANFLEVE
ncbi:MAG TPA: imidazole glycerol phosphate synthase subunit HisH [Steroidobacteraceae bacterium]|nr:imidazole glycerol phosphate synthase subunit HisH [Steroidobacteraceae bacterium]